MLKGMIQSKLMVKIHEKKEKQQGIREATLENKIFDQLLNNDDIPFGQSFMDMKTMRRVLDDNIEATFDKIENVSKSHSDQKTQLMKKLSKMK